jgi:hypothetical protein
MNSSSGDKPGRKSSRYSSLSFEEIMNTENKGSSVDLRSIRFRTASQVSMDHDRFGYGK